jgi:putative flavoprotein involved in K+ transport
LTTGPADVIVYATGYSSMNSFVADLVSREMADKVGKVWGLGSNTTKDPGPWEGERRNMSKPTQQEGYGSMAAICISRDSTRNSFPCT